MDQNVIQETRFEYELKAETKKNENEKLSFYHH